MAVTYVRCDRFIQISTPRGPTSLRFGGALTVLGAVAFGGWWLLLR